MQTDGIGRVVTSLPRRNYRGYVDVERNGHALVEVGGMGRPLQETAFTSEFGIWITRRQLGCWNGLFVRVRVAEASDYAKSSRKPHILIRASKCHSSEARERASLSAEVNPPGS